jgi:ABC-2 type transport system permease protein
VNAALDAELFVMRRRPLPYVVAGAWSLMVAAFAFVVPYIVYLTLDPSQASEREELLAVVLPEQAAATAISSYPMFGGAVMLVLGVLVSGSEYRWNTWTSRFTQGPSRTAVTLAKLVAAAAAAAAAAVLALLVALASSMVIASLAGRSLAPPALGEVLVALGGAVLLATTWAMVGVALGMVFRGATSALAVGLVWTLGLENAVVGVARLASWLDPVTGALLGPASGSLVAALGAPTQGDGGSPGVAAHTSGVVAVVVLACYLLAACALSTWLARRRDIT